MSFLRGLAMGAQAYTEAKERQRQRADALRQQAFANLLAEQSGQRAQEDLDSTIKARLDQAALGNRNAALGESNAAAQLGQWGVENEQADKRFTYDTVTKPAAAAAAAETATRNETLRQLLLASPGITGVPQSQPTMFAGESVPRASTGGAPLSAIPFGQASVEEMLGALSQAIARARPGTEFKSTPAGTELGLVTPTEEEQERAAGIRTDTGTKILLRTPTVKSAFAEALIKEAQQLVATATTDDEIALAKQKVEEARAEVKLRQHQGSLTAAQERALIRDQGRAEKELEAKIEDMRVQRNLQAGQLGVARGQLGVAQGGLALDREQWNFKKMHPEPAKDTGPTLNAKTAAGSALSNDAAALIGKANSAYSRGETYPTGEFSVLIARVNAAEQTGVISSEEAEAYRTNLQSWIDGLVSARTAPTTGGTRRRDDQ